jgi:hypothetical protein
MLIAWWRQQIYYIIIILGVAGTGAQVVKLQGKRNPPYGGTSLRVGGEPPSLRTR